MNRLSSPMLAATALAALTPFPAFAEPEPAAPVEAPLVVPPQSPASPAPPALSPEIRSMIDAAIASGDETAAVKVLAIARKVAPAAQADIDAIEAAWKTRTAAQAAHAEEERLAAMRSASPFDNWKGNVEFGAYRSTGNSTNLGGLASLALERPGVDVSHALSARAELQSTDGATTTERAIAAWQPRYRFDKQAYAYGLAQYEHDPFAGYDGRYTLGGGIGYRALAGKRLQLNLEGGPALRHTDALEGITRSQIVGRGSLDLKWQLTPTLQFSQQTAVYLEKADSNATLTTAIDTKLIGDLQARFSYNVQYEGNTPPGTQAVNTQSRITFVYGF